MFEESVWASMTSWLTPAVFFVLLNVVIGTIAFTTTLANKKHHQDSQTDSQHQQKPAGSSPLLQRLKSINFSGSYRSHEAAPSSLKLHPKKNTDSEPLFNFEPASQSQNFEMQSQYISSPQNQEKQGSFVENPREMQGHYFFEQNPSEISKERKESFAYQGNHHQKSPEIRPRREIKMEENVECRSENVEEIQRVEEEEEEVYSQPTEHHIFRSNSDTKPAAGEIPKKLPAKMKKSASLKSAFNHFEAEDIPEARRPATVKEKSSKAADVDNEVDAKADDFINKFKQQLKLQRLDSIIRYKEMIGKGKGGGG